MADWARRVTAPDFAVEVIAESTPGAAAARNAGLARVATSWVYFFDSDDTMRPGHCARMAEALTDEVDIVGWDVEQHLPAGRRRGRFVRRNAHFTNIFDGGFATQRWCARTDLVRSVGGWDAEARIWDDIELGTRLLTARPRIRRLKGEPTVDVFYSDESISNVDWLVRLQRMAVVLKLLEQHLPADKKHYAAYKAVIAAADARRLASHNADAMARARHILCGAIDKAPSYRRKALMHFIYNYAARFPRGTARILQCFI